MWLTFEQSSPAPARLRAALARTPPHVHLFAPGSKDITNLTGLAEECATVAGRSWRVTVGMEVPERVDVLIVTGHGADALASIWNLRRQRPDAVCLLWLFDNHVNYLGNLRTVLAVDGYFPSHAFCAGYLLNPHAPSLGHLPACCSQWNRWEIAAGLAAAGPRADKFLAAYVDYPSSARHDFLHRLTSVPEADVFLMPPEDRRRYRNKTVAERLAEWCGYKSSAVVPVERDLSTRLFDALACGQIPLVSDAVLDLDRVIPPTLQASLPILRFRDGDLASLLAVHAEANQRFDAEGEAGIRRRHDFVLAGHLLHHRLAAILSVLADLDSGRAVIGYHPPSGGLMLAAPPETTAEPRHSADRPGG